MANQPTKYRKFVVGAASAALVASAVAPVAFAAEFTDVKDNNSHKAAIDALSDAGVISGYPDGTFQPNKTLTRSDVVKLMGKWLVAEGYKVPTDYKTKPRFSDLKTTSNDELLKMSALVYDNGVFVGKPDGSLDAAGDITRENMAIVLVRAFDRVYDVDLVSYVKGQEFKKDVTDLGKAKAEARPAIDVLDFFDITNPAAPEFNPKNTTTRGQFASFLYKTTKVDFDQIGGEAVAPGVASVKAVNATTVEVTFKDKVENVNSLNFTIDGLTVSNAAVKQSDNKTVVLTTAVQKGGEKYTVKLDDKAIGSFSGVSAVVPTSVKFTSNSNAVKVGTQHILTADVGVKEANIPVTFNIDAPAGSLNQDEIVEVMTNAEGIATYSYTRYAAGVDTVSVYPTGSPATRDVATIYWGVEQVLSVTAADIESNTTNNQQSREYTAKLVNPATGEPLQNVTLHATFKENIDKDTKNDTNATISTGAGTAITPYQSENNQRVATIRTNNKGEATFTVTGSNTEATPIVFLDQVAPANFDNTVIFGNGNSRLDARELQVVAPTTKFVGAQQGYTFKFTKPASSTEAAVGSAFEYEVEVLKKDGKAWAGGTIHVGLDELLDSSISTDTAARIQTSASVVAARGAVTGTQGTVAVADKVRITLDENGKATFNVISAVANTTATPSVWIDQVEQGSSDGVRQDQEPQLNGPAITFRDEVVTQVNLADVTAGLTTRGAYVSNNAVAPELRLQLRNQSNAASSATRITDVQYTLTNTGTTPITVNLVANNFTVATGTAVNNVTIAAGNSYTVTGIANGTTNAVSLGVNAVDTNQIGKLSIDGRVNTPQGSTANNNLNLAGATKTVEFVNSQAQQTGELTGEVVGYSTADVAGQGGNHGYVIVKVDGQGTASAPVYRHYAYDNSNDTFYVGTSANFAALTQGTIANFESALSVGDRISINSVSYTGVRLINVDNSSNGTQVSGNTGATADTTPPTMTSAVATGNNTVVITFSENIKSSGTAAQIGAQFSVDHNDDGSVTDAGTSGVISGNQLTLTTTSTIATADIGAITYTVGATPAITDLADNALASPSTLVDADTTVSFGVGANASTQAAAGVSPVAEKSSTLFTAATGNSGAFEVTFADGTLSQAVPVTNIVAGDDASTVATKIATALNNNSTFAADYTASTNNGAVITTQNAGSESNATPSLTVTNAGTAGVTVTTATAETVAGSAGTAAQFNTVVTSGNLTGATLTKNVTVTDTKTGINRTVPVTFLATDNTPTLAATRIANALNADPVVAPAFTANDNAGTLELTQATDFGPTVVTVTVQ
ncbi:S-layer homology domain-containing protein [Sporosarcina sp. P17b]|uniref:S-layer homology domain-containing protein n=1 Tax=Sporosarcina sp. P17b TaxID=2048260 RepID=UPI000C17345A|nr:S-layer homology domain-containing protein [Sporosarcina sp. P17b]PIC74199.1 hypothetical protein CSV76_06825 [Sporosarcina sp. P17b]